MTPLGLLDEKKRATISSLFYNTLNFVWLRRIRVGLAEHGFDATPGSADAGDRMRNGDGSIDYGQGSVLEVCNEAVLVERRYFTEGGVVDAFVEGCSFGTEGCNGSKLAIGSGAALYFEALNIGFVVGDPVERDADAIAGGLEGVLPYDISEY